MPERAGTADDTGEVSARGRQLERAPALTQLDRTAGRQADRRDPQCAAVDADRRPARPECGIPRLDDQSPATNRRAPGVGVDPLEGYRARPDLRQPVAPD